MAALVVIVVVGAGALLFRDGDDPRAGSELLDPGPVAVATRTPETYRIVYRVESRAAEAYVASTDRLTIRRPFQARVEAATGPPPGEEVLSTTVNAFARLRSGDTTLAVPPGPAPPDRRTKAFLEEALEHGYAVEAERRRVADRICRVYRLGGDAGASSLARVVDTEAADRTDVCIDEAGLVLEDVTFAAGEVLSRKVAVEVSEDVDVDDEAFAAGEASMSAREGGGSVREVTADSRPPEATFWELEEVPDGFEHMGRYSVVPPQTGFDDPLRRGAIVTSMSDVWVRGADAIVVEQGGTLEGKRPFEDDPNARRVDLGELGEGEVRYSLRASEVRVLTGGGRFLRVGGTLRPSQLLEIARSLEPTGGGTLTFPDEGPSI